MPGVSRTAGRRPAPAGTSSKRLASLTLSEPAPRLAFSSINSCFLPHSGLPGILCLLRAPGWHVGPWHNQNDAQVDTGNHGANPPFQRVPDVADVHETPSSWASLGGHGEAQGRCPAAHSRRLLSQGGTPSAGVGGTCFSSNQTAERRASLISKLGSGSHLVSLEGQH